MDHLRVELSKINLHINNPLKGYTGKVLQEFTPITLWKYTYIIRIPVLFTTYPIHTILLHSECDRNLTVCRVYPVYPVFGHELTKLSSSRA